MTCPKCGTPVKSAGGVRHCTHCGWAESTELTARVPVVVVGPHGKALGRPVCSALLESDRCVLIGGVTRPNSSLPSRTAGGALIAGSFSSLTRELGIPAHVRDDVVVLYATQGGQVLPRMQEAHREGFMRHAVGSTDLPDEARQCMEHLAAFGSVVLWARNFSKAATYTDWLAESTAKVLEDYDSAVLDRHHSQKVGPLSGTALMYAESIARGRGLDPSKVVQRGGARPGAQREESDIPVAGFRLGGLPGEHEIFFANQHNLLTIGQRAYACASFAQDAILAIRWCAVLPLPGRRVRTMRDVMGLPDPANFHAWK